MKRMNQTMINNIIGVWLILFKLVICLCPHHYEYICCELWFVVSQQYHLLCASFTFTSLICLLISLCALILLWVSRIIHFVSLFNVFKFISVLKFWVCRYEGRTCMWSISIRYIMCAFKSMIPCKFKGATSALYSADGTLKIIEHKNGGYSEQVYPKWMLETVYSTTCNSRLFLQGHTLNQLKHHFSHAPQV